MAVSAPIPATGATSHNRRGNPNGPRRLRRPGPGLRAARRRHPDGATQPGVGEL